MTTIDLLDKTELWIQGVVLADVDLVALAAAAADALGLAPSAVFVTDVRDERVVFDIVRRRMEIEQLIGRQAALLTAVASVPGVSLADDAAVHSRGVLGTIGTPEQDVERILDELRRTDRGLRDWVGRRVAVVSTGAEVVAGEIADTNARAVAQVLAPLGYDVLVGGAVPDDERAIAGRVLRLVSEGCGVIITTGGVGAEDKDRTIEALQMADPTLATSVIATYQVGQGRHVKPHVRVGVAEVSGTRVIALPGPTREVQAALPVIHAGLTGDWGSERFAHEIGAVIRGLWTDAAHTHDHERQH